MTIPSTPVETTDVRLAVFPDDHAYLQTLLSEYRAYLATFIPEAHLCCDLPVSEIDNLPGPHAPPLGAFSIALVNGSPAGCAALRPITLLSGKTSSELRRMWVRPNFRGRSLGRRLARLLIEHARSLAHPDIYLDTLPAYMPAAQSLYRTLGFTPVPRYGSHIGDGLAYLRLPLSREPQP